VLVFVQDVQSWSMATDDVVICRGCRVVVVLHL
jgi:hypothetical protein